MSLLVIRTSAMGDVALTVPVLRALEQQYPDIDVVLLTRPSFSTFFMDIDNVSLFAADFKKRHKGLPGILRLYRDIYEHTDVDAVIDLHDVLRSKILRFLFRLSGVPSFVIDKGRKEKAKLIRGEKKKLLHSVERYQHVFKKAGYPLELITKRGIVSSAEALLKIDSLLVRGGGMNIGVAPYAKHKLKMWPEENMLQLLRLIRNEYEVKFWLFGGLEEASRLAEFQKKVPDSLTVPGKLSLDEELALMSRLDMMIAMDSSNMHMASLVGAKVISIWGATDPLAGFGAWRQPDEFAVRIPVEELTCRPCTIYGKGECRRGDFACMNWLTPEMVYKKIKEQIFDKK